MKKNGILKCFTECVDYIDVTSYLWQSDVTGTAVPDAEEVDTFVTSVGDPFLEPGTLIIVARRVHHADLTWLTPARLQNHTSGLLSKNKLLHDFV